MSCNLEFEQKLCILLRKNTQNNKHEPIRIGRKPNVSCLVAFSQSRCHFLVFALRFHDYFVFWFFNCKTAGRDLE